MYYEQLFWDAIKFNQIEVVKELLKQPTVDTSSDYNYALRLASYKHHEIFKVLLTDSKVIEILKELILSI